MAGTDWGGYNLPAIWQMLQDENVCTGADRVLAWEGLATSVREQHRRLGKAGEDLAAVWPPEKNASAAVFLDRIGELADSMKETLACAENTRAGLRGVVEAIGEAQAKVRELAAGRAQVSDDWVPRFIDRAEDDFDAEAQQRMREADAAIADYSTQMQAPALYSMGAGTSDSTTPLVNDDDGASASGSGSTGVRATPVPVAVPHDPVLPDPAGGAGPVAGGATGSGPGAGQDPALGIGPGLSGVTALPPAPTSGQGVPAGLPAGPGPGSGGSGGVPGSLGLIPGAGGVGGFGAGGIGVPAKPVVAPGGRQAVPIRRGLPSGAVIGEAGMGGPRGVPGQAPLSAQGSRRGQRTDESECSSRGDADEQWEALDGVAPVIAPAITPVRHDPGPGVLGTGR